MRHRGEVYRYEIDSVSGKLKMKPRKGDRWVVVREKKDFMRFASRETCEEFCL